MIKTSISLLFASIFSSLFAGTIYSPSLNTLPNSQGWVIVGVSNFTAPPALLGYNTSSDNAISGGFSRTDQSLNKSLGFEVSFDLQVLSETHDGNNGPNRSGFALIAVDSTGAKAIEIGFWTDQVWAQEVGFLKSLTEVSALDTTQLRTYRLAVSGDNYSLFAGNTLLFNGFLKDYALSIYHIPNFLYFGDDTTSARGSVNIGTIAVNDVPEPASMAFAAAGLLLIWRKYC